MWTKTANGTNKQFNTDYSAMSNRLNTDTAWTSSYELKQRKPYNSCGEAVIGRVTTFSVAGQLRVETQLFAERTTNGEERSAALPSGEGEAAL